MRASSLDASLLDSELHTLLLSPLHTSLKFFHPTFISNYDPELIALLRLSLWKVGIWDNNTSYGSLIQNLHYRTQRGGKLETPTKGTKVGYAILTVGVPYMLSKLETYLTTSANYEVEEGWKGRVQRWITNAENVYSTLSLLNFLNFLVNGRYRSIPDRLLRLRLVPLTKSHPHHLLSYEFLNRQLTWTSLTEFLLFILPLILPSYRRLRRRLLRSITRKPTTPSESTQPGDSAKQEGFEGTGTGGELAGLPVRFCAICYKQGREGRLITNPYQGECGHVYCYSCLVSEVVGEEGDGWSCLRCGYLVKRMNRWNERVEQGEGIKGKGEKNGEVETGVDGEESGTGSGSEGVEVTTPKGESVNDVEEEGEDEVEEVDEAEETEEEDNLFSRR